MALRNDTESECGTRGRPVHSATTRYLLVARCRPMSVRRATLFSVWSVPGPSSHPSVRGWRWPDRFFVKVAGRSTEKVLPDGTGSGRAQVWAQTAPLVLLDE